VDAVAGSLRLKKAEQNMKVMERVARILPVKPVEELRA